MLLPGSVRATLRPATAVPPTPRARTPPAAPPAKPRRSSGARGRQLRGNDPAAHFRRCPELPARSAPAGVPKQRRPDACVPPGSAASGSARHLWSGRSGRPRARPAPPAPARFARSPEGPRALPRAPPRRAPVRHTNWTARGARARTGEWARRPAPARFAGEGGIDVEVLGSGGGFGEGAETGSASNEVGALGGLPDGEEAAGGGAGYGAVAAVGKGAQGLIDLVDEFGEVEPESTRMTGWAAT